MDFSKLALKHRESLRIIHFEYTRLCGGTWKSLLEAFRDLLRLEVLYLLYPMQGEDRVTFSMEVFDNFWEQFVNVNDINDSRDMRSRLIRVVEFHDVRIEQYPDSDYACGSDRSNENNL